jgi:hypothetical protein
LYAEELLKGVKVERVNVGGRMIATAYFGTGEDVGRLSFMGQVINDPRFERGLWCGVWYS